MLLLSEPIGDIFFQLLDRKFVCIESLYVIETIVHLFILNITLHMYIGKT